MPFLPLKEKPFTNVDSIGNSVALEEFNDADKDDFYNNKRRKGLAEFVDLNTGYGVDGIFNPIGQDKAIAFSGGRMFEITKNKVVSEITGVSLNTGTPVKFADFGTVGFFCNNSKILKHTYGSGTSAFLTSANAPTNATHLGFIDQYLLALRANSARFDWADVDDPDTWLGEFATAESRPDNLVALVTAFGEIFLPGTKTVEHWADSGDPSAPFQRITGTITERGSISPYTVVQVDNSFMFLDAERRVIRMNGRDPQVISNPFDNEFQAITNIENAIGFHFNAEGDTKYILTFPTDDKTFVYDYKLDFWSRWSEWNERRAERRRFLGNCGVLVPSWGKYLVGDKSSGKIYEASANYFDDNGNTINSEIITGRIDWGTSRRKSCKKLTVRVKRGTGGLADSYKLSISKRDDGKTPWLNEKIIDLGKAGDNESYKIFRGLKTYRDRQWRFKLSGGELLFVSAEEDFTVI